MDRSRCNKKLWWLLVPILIIVVVVIVVVSVLVVRDNTTDPEVTSSQGILRGLNLVTRHSRNVFGFKGIPFAQPPVGDLRFQAPIAAGAWDGTLDASSDTTDCPAPSGSGDEDCLYLNVFTPQLPTSEDTTLLPVMMFIHGGSFKAEGNGADEYGPEYLLDQDVVLVVPSYRLGLLGFLSTGDEVAPGNYGLKDLVKALEWIRDNIEYFGGDPNQVTIFGQGSGSIVVHLLALSDLTGGLIHKYITESGTGLSYDAYTPKELLAERANRIGEHVGCPTTTSTNLINCLRGINTSELLDTDSIFYEWDTNPKVLWGPTTEPEMEGAFLTEKPSSLLNAGQIRDLPWISTCSRDEGVNRAANFYRDPDSFEDFLSNIDIALSSSLSYSGKLENVTAYTEALKSYYFNDLTADRETLLTNFTLLMGDALCGYATYGANQKQLAHAENPQYLGIFEYRGTLTYSNGDDDSQVAHRDELIYLFPSGRTFPSSSGVRNGTDYEMVDTMVGLWTSFATTGTPTTAWLRYSSLNNYLRIGSHYSTEVQVQYNFLGDSIPFWEDLAAATTWL